MVKKRVKQRIRRLRGPANQCPVTGFQPSLIPDDWQNAEGTTDTAVFVDKWPDCNLFNEKRIAVRAGLSVKRFRQVYEQSSHWHLRIEEVFLAGPTTNHRMRLVGTHTNSLAAGMVAHEEWKRQQRKKAAKKYAPGWYKYNWDVSSGDLMG